MAGSRGGWRGLPYLRVVAVFFFVLGVAGHASADAAPTADAKRTVVQKSIGPDTAKTAIKLPTPLTSASASPSKTPPVVPSAQPRVPFSSLGPRPSSDPAPPSTPKTVTPLLSNARTIAIGSVDPDSQIAVRGGLIVVATRAGTSAKAPGGIHVIDGSGAALKQLFVVPAPAGFAASGVALNADALTYGLSDNDSHGTVVRLGVDGGYRWTQSFDQRLVGTPIILPPEVTEASEQVAALLERDGRISLVLLDSASGQELSRAAVEGCLTSGRARLYAVRRAEARESGALVWCKAEVGSVFNFFPTQGTPRHFENTGIVAPQIVATRDAGNLAGLSGLYAINRDGEMSFAFKRDSLTPTLLVTQRGRVSYTGADPGLSFLDERSLNQVSTATLGNLRGTPTWNLIVASGDALAVFDTNVTEPALDRFPLGDLTLGGVSPTVPVSPDFAATHSVAADAALLESPNQDGVDGGFELLALADLPAPATFGGPSLHSLVALRGLPPARFDGSPSGDKGLVGEHHVVYASGGCWLAQTPQGLFRVEAGKLAAQLWSRAGATSFLRGFDAADGTVALVDDGKLLWCTMMNTVAGLSCTTLLEDPKLPGPVALSPDGRQLWAELPNGGVRQWSGAPSVATPNPRTITPRQNQTGAIRFLRAFTDELYVAGAGALEVYSTSTLQRVGGPHRLRADELERCGADGTYALVDGKVAYATTTGGFFVLPHQPALVSAIGCDGQGNLIGISSRYGAFKLSSPTRWAWGWLLLCLVPLGVGLMLFLGHELFKRKRLGARAATSKGVSVSLDTDTPLTDIGAATRDQRDLVEALFNFLDNHETLPPLTVGVYGAWGSGKSSIMRLLAQELDRTERYVTVWFNAWRHHQEEQLGPALLQTIVSEFRKQATAPIRWRNLWSALRNSRKTFYWALAVPCVVIPTYLLHLSTDKPFVSAGYVAAVVPFWKSVIQPLFRLFSIEPIDAVDKSFRERMGFFQEFSEEFERVIGTLPRDHYLCVFVDDLDRCPPDRVADVLEALNRLMDSQLCFVVLGMDPDMVRRCVEIRYKEVVAELDADDPGSGRRYGERFLEKLVGIAVTVPEVNPNDVKVKRPIKTKPRLWARIVDAASRRIDQTFAVLVVSVMVAFLFFSWQRDPGGVKSFVKESVSFFNGETQEDDGDRDTAKADKGEMAGATEPARAPSDRAPSSSPAVSVPAPAPPPSPTALKLDRQIKLERLIEPPSPVPADEIKEPLKEAVSTRASENKSAAGRNFALCTMTAIASLFGAFLLLHRFRQAARIGDRAEPLTDSEQFAAELGKASVGITNPRSLVRYRNLARLTYYLVNEEASRQAATHASITQPPRDEPWLSTFFSLFKATALDLAGPEPTVLPEQRWIEKKLKAWLGRVSTTAPVTAPVPASAPPPRATPATDPPTSGEMPAHPPDKAPRPRSA